MYALRGPYDYVANAFAGYVFDVVTTSMADAQLSRSRSLTRNEKLAQWITPLTASTIPTIEELRDEVTHPIGRRERVVQFITPGLDPEHPFPWLHTLQTRQGVCEPSEEWSEYYQCPIIIFKEVSR